MELWDAAISLGIYQAYWCGGFNFSRLTRINSLDKPNV